MPRKIRFYINKTFISSFYILRCDIHILFYMVFNGNYELVDTEILLREYYNQLFLHSTFPIPNSTLKKLPEGSFLFCHILYCKAVGAELAAHNACSESVAGNGVAANCNFTYVAHCIAV